ncbi:hypothetical protein B9Z55_022653 [Caenorhabditis nigoni]|uniref:Uncharacterized protein n=1 Tax=Caenorhabditis nigoni TaxID=1611254 RepID=A0A2G5SLC4_9PELO|nr:hypothetical protein B9Z55_022653 [Caenorhabditis nigoni]
MAKNVNRSSTDSSSMLPARSYFLAFLLLGAFFVFSDARTTTRMCLKKLNNYITGICGDLCANDVPDFVQAVCSGIRLPRSEIKHRCCP